MTSVSFGGVTRKKYLGFSFCFFLSRIGSELEKSFEGHIFAISFGPLCGVIPQAPPGPFGEVLKGKREQRLWNF